MHLSRLILPIVLLLTGCANPIKKPSEWPQGIPSVEFFNEKFDLDKQNSQVQTRRQYLTWVKRFYNGWLLFDHGWVSMSEELLEGLQDSAQSPRIAEKLRLLGELIAQEWAKDNSRRLIPTSSVTAWGQALVESMTRHEEEQLIDSVLADVSALLQGSLNSNVIVLERYYIFEDEVFN